MKTLEPIPTPFSVRWREFRVRFLPPLFFLLLMATVALIWSRIAPHATLVGIGEGARSVVTAPQSATFARLLVEPYSVVAQGTPVAVLTPVDVRADFDLLRSYFDLAQASSEPSLAEENAMNFERIRVELLRNKADLAIAQVKLKQAERDVARNTPLYREKLVSEDIYELSMATRDALAAEVRELGAAVTEIEQRLTELRTIGEPQSNASQTNELLARLEQAQAAVASNLAPVTLVAPITGMVSMPLRNPGEFVAAGEPLFNISALQAERLIAYLRQPYAVDPEIGMAVRVTTKTSRRQTFESYITQVGAQVEPITNSLGYARQDVLVDSGLPVIVHIPADVHIRPGEAVDVTILSGSRHPFPPTPQISTDSGRRQM
jgi:multidrug resistance efflux pump